MANHLTDVEVGFVSLVDRAAVRDPANPDQPMRFLLTKSEQVEVFNRNPEGGDSMTQEEMAAAVKKAQDDAAAEIKKAQDDVVKAEAERDAAVEMAKKKMPPADDNDADDADDVNKADLSPAVKARLEKAEAETVALRKQADEATALAKAERDLRVEREFIEVAKTEYGSLGQDPAEFGPLLKRASETLSKEDYERLHTLFKATGAQIKTGDMFKAYGSSGDGPRSGDALSEVTLKAEELRKADSTLSVAEAQAQVFASNPALAAQYLTAMGSGPSH